jgi:hypothetical protein
LGHFEFSGDSFTRIAIPARTRLFVTHLPVPSINECENLTFHRTIENDPSGIFRIKNDQDRIFTNGVIDEGFLIQLAEGKSHRLTIQSNPDNEFLGIKPFITNGLANYPCLI